MLEQRQWHRCDGASAEELAALIAAAPVALPESYLQLLRATNGGEGPLPVQPLWLVLYPAKEVAQIQREATFKEFFPGFFVIGGNGGGEAVAFDLRAPSSMPVVAFDMTNIDLTESVRPLAASFDGLLDLMGQDAP